MVSLGSLPTIGLIFGGLAFMSFFGKNAGQGIGSVLGGVGGGVSSIAKGLSDIFSIQVKPSFVPEIGLSLGGDLKTVAQNTAKAVDQVAQNTQQGSNTVGQASGLGQIGGFLSGLSPIGNLGNVLTGALTSPTTGGSQGTKTDQVVTPGTRETSDVNSFWSAWSKQWG